jgi:hypothetical protein
MIEYIKHNNQLISIIIKSNYVDENIKFFTPESFELQLGYMNRRKNYRIKPHIHSATKRNISKTFEVLFIRKGKVQIDFYDKNKIKLQSKILNKGDTILIGDCGHGFIMLEDSEILEVKQGPYQIEKDKYSI